MLRRAERHCGAPKKMNVSHAASSSLLPAAELTSWPALVISSSLPRFDSCAAQVRRGGFSPSWVPAIFVPSTYNECTRGGVKQGLEGHRLAFRNALQIIASSGQSMALFEDDAYFVGHVGDVRKSINDCAQSRCHVLYLGYKLEPKDGRLGGNHAAWISPAGASVLLATITADCTGGGIDGRMADATAKGRLRVMRAPEGGKRPLGSYAYNGQFVQNRQTLVSALHHTSRGDFPAPLCDSNGVCTQPVPDK